MSYNRHRFVFFTLRPVFRLFLKIRYNFSAKPYRESKGPLLILPNHNCTMDPFMVGMSFQKPIYYVTSDHLLRLGFISKVIHFLVAPISKLKASSDLVTIKQVLKKLRENKTVCIFPEGNRSFHGCTTFISPAIGKLIKASKVDVPLYIIDNGYLSDPRWAKHIRRGKMHGYVKRVLKPEEYKDLTAEQITEIVRSELDVNPTPMQPRNTLVFSGKDLAENLELALFICPRCKTVGSLYSKGSYLMCNKCDLQVEYLSDGYLSSPEDAIETVKQWDDWQRQFIMTQAYSNYQMICEDRNEMMYYISRAQKNDLKGTGTICLYPNRIEFIDEESEETDFFYFDCIDNVIVHGKQVLQISYIDRTYYEFKNKNVRSALKYMYYFNYFTNKRKGHQYEFFGI